MKYACVLFAVDDKIDTIKTTTIKSHHITMVDDDVLIEWGSGVEKMDYDVKILFLCSKLLCNFFSFTGVN